MKKLVIIFSIIAASLSVKAQSISGAIKIKEQSKVEIQAKNNKVVSIYATFRENQYPILFSLKGADLPYNSEKQQVVNIQFITTVKKDGKIIASIPRKPIPFFPGDMLMPVETFDFISILSSIQKNGLDKVSEIPAGNYEIVLEAKVSEVKGEISPLSLFVKF
ncbi:hypothetical protein [Pedobacter alpinus]|uniref:Uncharacterized protein n=1 Tax=Pedobacter alpinus TaxID=1590643 RepID=A0ABW5TXB1_9SPHI